MQEVRGQNQETFSPNKISQMKLQFDYIEILQSLKLIFWKRFQLSSFLIQDSLCRNLFVTKNVMSRNALKMSNHAV